MAAANSSRSRDRISCERVCANVGFCGEKMSCAVAGTGTMRVAIVKLGEAGIMTVGGGSCEMGVGCEVMI